jgi:predicted dehydrogenase
MIAVVKPDVVHVLTPPQTHGALVRQSLEANAHVICEKPLAPTLSETEQLLALAETRRLHLIESRNLLFNDAVLKFDEIIAAGQVGNVREIEILLALNLPDGPFGDLNLSSPGLVLPGGAVHDFLPHLTYLFLHFAKDEQFRDVRGWLENRSGNARVGYDHMDALVHAGPVRGRLRVASDLAPDGFRLFVRGTAGTLETDLYNPFLRYEGGRNIGKRAPLEQIRSGASLFRSGIRNFRDKVAQHGTYHGMPRMLDAIYGGILGGEGPPILPRHIRQGARLVDALVALAGTR